MKMFVCGVQSSKGHLGYLQMGQKVLPACRKQKLAHAKGLLSDLCSLGSSHSVNNP